MKNIKKEKKDMEENIADFIDISLRTFEQKIGLLPSSIIIKLYPNVTLGISSSPPLKISVDISYNF